MSNSDAIEVEGLVLEILGGGKYRVQLVDMDMEVEAYAAGKMKRFRIKIIPGDLVTVELNPYEPTKGRIVYRTINKGSKSKKRNERAFDKNNDKKNSKKAGKIVKKIEKKDDKTTEPKPPEPVKKVESSSDSPQAVEKSVST